MTTPAVSEMQERLIDSIRGTRDAISVRRVFGDPHEVDGTTFIPVARVAGGAGGGGGASEGDEQGSGFGTGFGITAQPIGVYRLRDGHLVWRPAIDVSRLIARGQVLVGIAVVCATLVVLRRSR